MKRPFLALVLVALALAPMSAQLRLDLGIDVPKGAGALLGSSVTMSSDVANALSSTFFPFPEASLHYRFGNQFIGVGLGIRAFTFIVESAAWPNAFVELGLGPVVLEAQVGGGLFAVFGVSNNITTGNVFFPDLSAWIKLGKTFRLGVGTMGIFLPGQSGGTVPFVFYLGAKAAINI